MPIIVPCFVTSGSRLLRSSPYLFWSSLNTTVYFGGNNFNSFFMPTSIRIFSVLDNLGAAKQVYGTLLGSVKFLILSMPELWCAYIS